MPLVTSPINDSLSLNIFVFSLAIIFPSGLMPTLILLIPLINCSEIILEPINPPLEILSFYIAHLRFDSIGVFLISSS